MMRDGYVGEYATINDCSAYLMMEGRFNYLVNISNFKKLEQYELVVKKKKNLALYQYHLTDLGKIIEL